MIVGYKLIDSQNNVINQWGGIWGHCPGVPNPLILPNGIHVNGADLNVDYYDFKLIPWEMEEPKIIPDHVSPRQVRLLFLNKNLLDDVELMVSQKSKEAQINWEYATKFERSDSLLIELTKELNLALDDFLIEASKL